MFPLLTDLRQYPATESCFAFGDSLHLTLKNDLNKGEIVQYLTQKGHEDVEVETILPTIEDCFMALMK
jgi:ABC-2 type transport system ATP-binding protein